MQASVNQDRQKWIGGSDVPIIMGISPFTTRYDLLLFKAGIIKEQEFKGNEYTEYGNVMEPKIREYINLNCGYDFVEGKHEDETTGFRCHTDGENENTILEIKTTSQIHNKVDEYKIYLVQMLFYMMNTNKKFGMLAVYNRPDNFDTTFNSNRLLIYDIQIDDYKDLCDEIINAINQFKKDVEKLKENPLLSEEDLLPTPIQKLSTQIEEIEKQLVGFKELENKQNELKEKLYNAMEEYGIKSWETPNKSMLLTKVASTPDKTEMVFNEDRFKKEQEKIYNEYLEEKVKKGKSGYIKITMR